MLLFQRSLLRAGALLGAFLLLTLSSSAQITFTFNVTANGSGLAYTSGHTYTFTYTLNNYFPTTPAGSALTNVGYTWSEETPANPILFSNFSGDSLIGTFSRPSDPSHGLSVNDNSQGGAANRLSIYVVDDSFDSGLTLNGTGEKLYMVKMEGTFTGLEFDATQDGLPPDPYAFFSGFLGTYSAASTSDAFVLDENYNDVYFTINSLTIAQAAVPEPSTYAAIFGLLALGFAGWRKRRKATA